MKRQAYWTLARLAFPLALLAALAGGLAAPAWAQQPQGEPALVKRQADLREQPGEASRSLAPLAPQTAITRTGERQGAWVQVRTAQGQTGWLHIFDVAAPGAPAQGGGNVAAGALRGVTGFFNRGSGPNMGATTATSTVGIRGLGAEDLANAQPNLGAVSQAEGMRLDSGAAQQFAQQAQLTAHPVVPLPEPPKPRNPNNPAGGAPGNNAF